MVTKNVSIAQATAHRSHPAQMLYASVEDARTHPFGFLAMCEDGKIRGGVATDLMALAVQVYAMNRDHNPTEVMSFDFTESDPRVLFPARRSA